MSNRYDYYNNNESDYKSRKSSKRVMDYDEDEDYILDGKYKKYVKKKSTRKKNQPYND